MCPLKEEVTITSGEWEVLANHGAKVNVPDIELSPEQGWKRVMSSEKSEWGGQKKIGQLKYGCVDNEVC